MISLGILKNIFQESQQFFTQNAFIFFFHILQIILRAGSLQLIVFINILDFRYELFFMVFFLEELILKFIKKIIQGLVIALTISYLNYHKISMYHRINSPISISLNFCFPGILWIPEEGSFDELFEKNLADTKLLFTKFKTRSKQKYLKR